MRSKVHQAILHFRQSLRIDILISSLKQYGQCFQTNSYKVKVLAFTLVKNFNHSVNNKVFELLPILWNKNYLNSSSAIKLIKIPKL